jgi:D-2-hydroxyacid dehydrogenase (NADP+)
MGKVLIIYDFRDEHVDKLRKTYDGLDFVTAQGEEEVFANLGDTEVLIPSFKFKKEMLDAAPALKWIQAVSAGVDHMPLEAIKARGILLTNGRGIHKVHMAEYAIAAMVDLARNWHTIFRNQIRGVWDRSIPQGEINGAVVGIIGLGSIGKEIARRASFMGMRVIGVKSRPEPLDSVEKVYGPEGMEEVFRQSDYVINLLPYTRETEKVLDRTYFGQMKETACFINMGRGKTVNEPDLIEALQKRRMRAMVSDVYYQEPLPEESPLWGLHNVILTPHVCGASSRYKDRALEIVEHNMKVYTGGGGEMMNVVDLDRGY